MSFYDFSKVIGTMLMLSLALSIATPKRADAMFVGITSLTSGLIIVGGTCAALSYGVVNKNSKNDMLVSIFIPTFLIGLMLDDHWTAPKSIDVSTKVPESLEISQGVENANQIWSQMSEIDHGFDGKKIQAYYPQLIKEFIQSNKSCDSKCKKQLGKSEQALADDVKSKIEAVVNEGKPEASQLKLSTMTVKYLIESFGYTFATNLK